jgi:hypothetical protein
MLGFFRFGSRLAVAAVAAGLVGTFGGCGPGQGTCSPDNHLVLDTSGATSATCTAQQACVASMGTAACVACDPTQCLKGDTCITGYQNYDDAVKNNPNSTSECRLTCAAPTDCPFNYHCFTPTGGGQAYCVNDRTTYPPTTAGTPAGSAPWGAPCSPSHIPMGSTDPNAPLIANTDCDTKDQFWCYGQSPTDANAFCTQFQCNDDGDCPGGWWCATVNDTPNVTTTPGTYCAPCKADADCPLNQSAKQHCVSADANGGAELTCAAECAADANCPLDYECKDPGIGQTVCVPRAATCLGTGQFCDPCHSDGDCQKNGGYCLKADYSTEHFCSAPTPSCTYNSTSGFMDTCPALPAAAKPPNTTTDGVGCSYNGQAGFPQNQCYGGNVFGLGCYTFHCSGAGGSCGQNSDCCSNKCDTSMSACM